MAIFELSSERYKNGRRPFTAVLYELQPPECVVNNVGTKYNKNGITFLEEYAAKQLDSIVDMSITVSFLDDGRTIICDHGDTDLTCDDGIPKFENATVIGHFTKGYIDDVQIDGETKRCVLGDGIIDEMRYPAFVKTLETELSEGMTINGSIEIFRSKGNKAIVYKSGYMPKGRIPVEYTHTGWAMVVNPSDVTSALMELNSNNTNKEEKKSMDEKTMKSIIVSAIAEANSKNDELTNKISELNSAIADKDARIEALNTQIKDNKTSDEDKDAKIQELNEKITELESKLNECKKAEQNSALDKALEAFSEDEQKYAETEINSFRENPLEGNVDAIVNAINAGIGKAFKAKAAEINSKGNDSELDIYSEISSVVDNGEGEVDIFKEV